MHRLLGLLLRFLQRLDDHQWYDTSLFIWLVSLLLLLSLFPILGLLPGGLTLSAALWISVLLLYLGRWWGRRHFYTHFVPEPMPALARDIPPLYPADKLLLHATGLLGVEGKQGKFNDLIAYYRTFETREHAIMARQTPSRFLWGRTPPRLLGMWYAFVHPHELQDVQAGKIYLGSKAYPALRLHICRQNEKGKEVREKLYLRFSSPEDRARVLADLLLDMGGPAARPWRAPA